MKKSSAKAPKQNAKPASKPLVKVISTRQAFGQLRGPGGGTIGACH